MRKSQKTALMLAVMAMNGLSLATSDTPWETNRVEARSAGEGVSDSALTDVGEDELCILITDDWGSYGIQGNNIYSQRGGCDNLKKYEEGNNVYFKVPASSAKTYTDEVSKGKANVSLDNITNAGKNVIKNTVSGDISAAETRAKNDATTKANNAKSQAISAAASDATNKANKAESNSKAYTDNVAKGKANINLDNINDAGKKVIRDLAKEEMKDTGVKVDGPTVIIEKTTEIKGELIVDDTIHGKGDLEIDGKTTLHGDTVIEGDTIIKGNTIHEGKTINKGEVVNEANVTTKGKTTHEGEVINKSLVTNERDVHTKGNEIIGGNAIVHGDTMIDGKATLKGDTIIGDSVNDKVVVNGTAEFKENTQFDKDVTVKGSEIVEQNLYIKGNNITEGDSIVKGNTTLGDDKNSDVLEVNAKTNIHGDTVVGDSSTDRFTVNATSEFKSDATFDQNVLVKGDQTVEGNSHTKGNAEVDKDMTVHGAMVVEGEMKVSDDFGTKGNMTVDKTLTVGGDAHISGDTILDGKFFAKRAATFGDSVDIAKNLTVGGNVHVIGDSVVDGDSYARSFSIGNEKYIDSNGINANGHKIRNVADGEISPNSLDAVNGRQLYHTREALQHNIDQVGAATAAMASLHPLDYEHDDKLSVSAAMGNYKDKTAMAVGVFYRPNIKSMVNLSGTLGYGDNMFGIGVSTKMGKVTEEDNMTDEQLRDKVSEIHDENKELREENGKLKSEVSDLKQEILKSHEQATAQENQIAALMSKVDGLVSELATLKAESQK